MRSKVKKIVSSILVILVFFSSLNLEAFASDDFSKTVFFINSGYKVDEERGKELINITEEFYDKKNEYIKWVSDPFWNLKHSYEEYESIDEIAKEIFHEKAENQLDNIKEVVFVFPRDDIKDSEREYFVNNKRGEKIKIDIVSYEEVGVELQNDKKEDEYDSTFNSLEQESSTTTSENSVKENIAPIVKEKLTTIITSVKLENKVISKDANMNLKVGYGVAGDAYGSITIHDSKGNVIKTLYDNFIHKKGYYSLTWNLKNEDNNFVENGNYTIKLRFKIDEQYDEIELPFVIEGENENRILSNVKLTKSTVDIKSGEKVEFFYNVNKNAKGTIDIYDEKSNKIISLYDNVPHNRGYYKGIWNGKDSSGKYVEDGVYTILFDFLNEKKALKVTVRSQESNNDNYEEIISSVKLNKTTVDVKSGEYVEFFYNVKKASKGTISVYDNNSNKIVTLYDNTSHNTGYYKGVWNGKDSDGNYVKNGEYTIRINFSNDQKELKVLVKNHSNEENEFIISGIKVEKTQLSIGEDAKIYYSVPETAFGTIVIKNEKGEIVKTLYDKVSHKKGYYVLSWNLKDRNNNYVKTGNYTFDLCFNAGKQMFEKAVHFSVKNDLNSLQLTGVRVSSERIELESSSFAEIFYGVSENSSGTVKITDSFGNTIKTFYNEFAHTKGYYKLRWDMTDDLGRKIKKGVYSVELCFKNESEEVKTDVKLEVVDVDLIKSCYVNSSKININKDSSLSLKYHLIENSVGTIQVLDNKNKVISTLYNKQSHKAGYYKYDWNLKDSAGKIVKEGKYKIVLNFVSNSGKTYENKIDFEIVDTIAIAHIKVTPKEIGKGNEVNLLYHPTHDSYGTIEVCDSNGKTLRTFHNETFHRKGYYKVIWNQKDQFGKMVEPGNYFFKMKFYGNGGQTAEETVEFQIKEKVIKKVWIDAGHGGVDPGAVSNGRIERDDNLVLALELRRVLEQQELQVYMSRVDIDSGYKDLMSLKKRILNANEKEVDVFVSLHRDSAVSSARGYTVYTHNQYNPENINPTAYPNKNSGCLELSKQLNTELNKVGAFKSRGIIQGSATGTDDLMVNRISNMPSCLLEMGFISNVQDNRIFDTYLKQYAKAIAKGIMNYLEVPFDEKKYTMH